MLTQTVCSLAAESNSNKEATMQHNYRVKAADLEKHLHTFQLFLSDNWHLVTLKENKLLATQIINLLKSGEVCL